MGSVLCPVSHLLRKSKRFKPNQLRRRRTRNKKIRSNLKSSKNLSRKANQRLRPQLLRRRR
jgi:hypothetical protein